MSRLHTDPKVQRLLDRYNDRIEVRVAERDGGQFDIALTVDGFEIASVRLRSKGPGPVLLYSGPGDEDCSIGPDGGLFALPV